MDATRNAYIFSILLLIQGKTDPEVKAAAGVWKELCWTLDENITGFRWDALYLLSFYVETDFTVYYWLNFLWCLYIRRMWETRVQSLKMYFHIVVMNIPTRTLWYEFFESGRGYVGLRSMITVKSGCLLFSWWLALCILRNMKTFECWVGRDRIEGGRLEVAWQE